MNHLLDSTFHYKMIKEFMEKGEQNCPDRVEALDPLTAQLRAKLILEEALELINKGLGIEVTIGVSEEIRIPVEVDQLKFTAVRVQNTIDLIDGCVDLEVVTKGALIASGIPDAPFIFEIAQNNLSKVKDGVKKDENGKIMKPEGYQPPNIKDIFLRVLEAQTETQEQEA